MRRAHCHLGRPVDVLQQLTTPGSGGSSRQAKQARTPSAKKKTRAHGQQSYGTANKESYRCRYVSTKPEVKRPASKGRGGIHSPPPPSAAATLRQAPTKLTHKQRHTARAQARVQARAQAHVLPQGYQVMGRTRPFDRLSKSTIHCSAKRKRAGAERGDVTGVGKISSAAVRKQKCVARLGSALTASSSTEYTWMVELQKHILQQLV